MPFDPISDDEHKALVAAAGTVKAAPQRKPLSMGQSAVKFGADLLQPVGSFTGALLGGTGGAAAGMGTPLSIPEAMWGAGVGGAAGGALGAGGQLALYKMAGIPSESTLGGQLTHIATGGALGGAQGLLGGGSDALIARGAPMAAKLAVGRGAPGAENEVLASDMKPNESWIAHANDAIGNLKAGLMARIHALDASGKTANVQGLAQTLDELKQRQATGNLLSNAPEQALNEASGVMASKIGPKTVTTGGGAGFTAPPRVTTVTPPQPVPYSSVQTMKEVAQEGADGLYAAREAAAGAGKRMAPPSALESAYANVANKLQRIIEGEPTHGKAIGAANQEMQRLMRLRKIAINMAGRAPSKAMTGLSMIGAEIPAIYTHNPYMAAAGVPVGIAAHIAQSPSAQLAMARLMANPYARMASQLPLRAGVAAAQDITGIGMPRSDQ